MKGEKQATTNKPQTVYCQYKHFMLGLKKCKHNPDPKHLIYSFYPCDTIHFSWYCVSLWVLIFKPVNKALLTEGIGGELEENEVYDGTLEIM